MGTALILKFFDTLFDSLTANCSIRYKPLKRAIQPKSGHIRYWNNAIEDLNQMFFQKPGTNDKIIPSSLKCFKLTLQGFKDIARIFFSKNLRSFYPRPFNQDSLENFFAQIRLDTEANKNLCCLKFEDSFKSLLIRGRNSPHLESFDCKKTFELILVRLKHLLKVEDLKCEEVELENENSSRIHIFISECRNLDGPIDVVAQKYISRHFGQKLINFLECEHCKKHILNIECCASNLCREYLTKNFCLKYCNNYFVSCIERSVHICDQILSNFIIESNLNKCLKHYVGHHVKFSFTCCHKDDVINLVTEIIAHYCIKKFVNRVNIVLKGKNAIPETSCDIYKRSLM